MSRYEDSDPPSTFASLALIHPKGIIVTSILLIAAEALWKIASANDYQLLREGYTLLKSGISAGSSLIH